MISDRNSSVILFFSHVLLGPGTNPRPSTPREAWKKLDSYLQLYWFHLCDVDSAVSCVFCCRSGYLIYHDYHVVSASEDIGMGSTTDTWRYATGKQRFDGTSTSFSWRLLIGVGKYKVIWTLLCCTPLERPNICGFHCLGEKLQKNEHFE